MAPNLSLLSTEALAEILGLSVRTLEGWRLNGTGPRFIRSGRHSGTVRYRLSAVEQWLASRELRSTSDHGHDPRRKSRRSGRGVDARA